MTSNKLEKKKGSPESKHKESFRRQKKGQIDEQKSYHKGIHMIRLKPSSQISMSQSSDYKQIAS
uniref:Uncharacterized protein n=1 Tax=Rhizophora mucronata TaxID=61149 RepID=A0A2P2QQG3_RHIMU